MVNCQECEHFTTCHHVNSDIDCHYFSESKESLIRKNKQFEAEIEILKMKISTMQHNINGIKRGEECQE